MSPSAPQSSLFKVMEVEFDGRLIGHIHDARGGDADRDYNRVADFLLGRPHFERFLDVSFQTALALGYQRAAKGNQFLCFKVEGCGSEIAFLVKRQIDVTKSRLDHTHRFRGCGHRWSVIRHSRILTYSNISQSEFNLPTSNRRLPSGRHLRRFDGSRLTEVYQLRNLDANCGPL